MLAKMKSPRFSGAFHLWFLALIFGGAGGIRTRYLLTASQTFSRVNYSPTNLSTNLTQNEMVSNSEVRLYWLEVRQYFLIEDTITFSLRALLKALLYIAAIGDIIDL